MAYNPGTLKGDFFATIDATGLIEARSLLATYPEFYDRVLMNAVNWTTRKGMTRVRRTLSTEMGIPVSRLTSGSYGLRVRLAFGQNREAMIVSRGIHTPLSYFRPVQLRKGVRARPWGQTRTFRKTFLVSMGSGFRGVFKRTHYTPRTKRNGKPKKFDGLEQLWGPSMPREMMRGKSGEIFKGVVNTDMGPRINHELRRILKPRKPGAGRQSMTLPALDLGTTDVS